MWNNIYKQPLQLYSELYHPHTHTHTHTETVSTCVYIHHICRIQIHTNMYTLHGTHPSFQAHVSSKLVHVGHHALTSELLHNYIITVGGKRKSTIQIHTLLHVPTRPKECKHSNIKEFQQLLYEFNICLGTVDNNIILCALGPFFERLTKFITAF